MHCHHFCWTLFCPVTYLTFNNFLSHLLACTQIEHEHLRETNKELFVTQMNAMVQAVEQGDEGTNQEDDDEEKDGSGEGEESSSPPTTTAPTGGDTNIPGVRVYDHLIFELSQSSILFEQIFYEYNTNIARTDFGNRNNVNCARF